MTRVRPAAIAIVATLVLALPVLASHVEPELVTGAESCGPLSPGTVELLVDASQLADGAVAEGDFEADVSLEGTIEDGTVAFRDASLPVRAALVAGATSSNLYEYEEPVTEDDGLVAPDGQPIVSVSFCYVNDDGGGGNGGGGGGDGAGGGTAPNTDAAPSSTSGRAPGLLMVLAGIGLIASAVLLAQPATLARARRLVDGRDRRSRR